MSNLFSTTVCLTAIERLVAIALLIAWVEDCFIRYKVGGLDLMSWEICRERAVWLSGKWIRPVLDYAMNKKNYAVIQYISIICSLVLLISEPSVPWLRAVCDILLLGCLILQSIRSPFGLDGADQMMTVILASASLARIAHAETSVKICLHFISLQAALAYASAGLAKLVVEPWRSGQHLSTILSTKIYGNSRLGRFLQRHRQISRFCALGMICWESLFPLFFVVHPTLGNMMLVIGVIFHLMTAIFMGLNTFLWSFLATYPALLWSRHELQSFLHLWP